MIIPLLADISTLPWVAIVAVGGSLMIGPVVIFLVFQASQHRQEMWHQTARIALEKGQPIPPLPADLAPSTSPVRTPNDIRTGLVLIAVGAGLWLFLGSLLGRAMGFVGAIPGFIGLALLLYGLVTARATRPSPPADRS